MGYGNRPGQSSSVMVVFALLTWFMAKQVSSPVTFPLSRTVWLSELRSASASLRDLPSKNQVNCTLSPLEEHLKLLTDRSTSDTGARGEERLRSVF